MSKASYVRGFVKAAKEKGVDPVPLIKFALSDGAEDAANFAEGAAAGAFTGMLASPLTGLAGWALGKRLEQKADIMEDKAFSKLTSTDPQYKELYRRHGPTMEAADSARMKLRSIKSDLELAQAERDMWGISKAMIPKKEKLLHPFQYRRLADAVSKSTSKVQSLQDAASQLRAKIDFHNAAARPLMSRSVELQRIAAKKILPRLVRRGGRLAPWIGLLLPSFTMGGIGGAVYAHEKGKERGSKPKNQPVMDNKGKQ